MAMTIAAIEQMIWGLLLGGTDWFDEQDYWHDAWMGVRRQMRREELLPIKTLA